MEVIWNELVKKTKAFVESTGFEKAVIGLSGGIDSAIVACIAVEALGKENLLAIMMPSPYSSEGSINDSVELARNWGFQNTEIPITQLMKIFDVSLLPFFQGTDPGIPEENIQARIRAVLLMAIANKQDRLLLNTCNKSEDFTGYCTLYGDSCGAIAPIGGLYKTEVYALAKWINDNPELPNIPETIVSKEPSAELSDGQRDKDSLPPYEVLDAILKGFLEENQTLSDLVGKGFEPPVVDKVIQRMKSSEFKRQQSPPVIEIERRTA